jgi:hypothetical protein
VSKKRNVTFTITPTGAAIAAASVPDAPDVVRLDFPNQRLSFDKAKVVIINGNEFVRRDLIILAQTPPGAAE